MIGADAIYASGLRRATADGVPRCWPEALRLFGEAADAGHEQAASACASLFALGAGDAPDWPGAVEILERSARTGRRSARMLELLRRMALTPAGDPISIPTLEPISTSPRLAVAKGLFSPDECAHVRGLAAPHLRPSLVADPRSGRLMPHPVRTSDGAVLGPLQQDLVVHALNRRIAAATGTCVERGEPLTVLRYAPGQEYRTHHDCLPGEFNQRELTAIVYLGGSFEGGATAFEALGRAFWPEEGDALVFGNTLEDGRPDPRSRHAGLPVRRGEKWIATRWIRRERFDPWGLYGDAGEGRATPVATRQASRDRMASEASLLSVFVSI